MRDKLRTLLGIESGEEAMVSMLLTQSVFLGIFFGAFDIVAHSLLLSVFDVKIMARGYIVSGIAGIILTSLYSWLRTKIKFKNVAILFLFSITALTFFLWSILIFAPAKWIILAVFIMFGPLNILAILISRGTTDRLFNAAHSQRLLRLADAGLIMGIILISYAIPVLLALKLKTQNILLLSGASVFIASVIQAVINRRVGLNTSERAQRSEKHVDRNIPYSLIKEDRYARTIVIFAVLSVLVLYFIQYLFMAVTREQYPLLDDMAVFLGLFTGSMMIVVLITKRIFYKYIIHNYSLRACLVFAPFLIVILTALSILPGLLTGNTSLATGGFIIFFILIALSRVFSKTMRDSIWIVTLRVIYQSIAKRIKFDFSSGFAGTLNEMMVLFSGVILTIAGLFNFIRLIHFSILLLVICIVWLFIALRLFQEYRKSILDDYNANNLSSESSEISRDNNNLKNRFSAYINFRTDYFGLISGKYSALNDVSNNNYYEEIIGHAHSKTDINLLPVLKKIANNKNLNEGVRHHSAEVLEFFQKITNSGNPEDEMISGPMRTLSGSRMPQTTEILRLLRDNSLESKRIAIYMIGKFRLYDLLSEVCGCLNTPGLVIDASEVLRSFGSEAEDELIRFYLITSGNQSLSKTILHILGMTCTKETCGFLFSRLWSNSRQLKEIVIKYLIYCNFKPADEEKQRLNQLIYEVIGLITWNLSAKISLEKDNDKFLLENINKEINRWNKFLFNLLSVTYNSGTINRIRDYLAKETMESVCYALEITDIIVADSIKSILSSLFDVMPDKDKLKKLFRYFPGKIPTHRKLLEDIINRDYNLISLWTKACTLRSIVKIENDETAESATALLFSPEEIIREESANLIARSRPDLYISASRRIPETIRKRLDEIIDGTTDKRELLFEKVQFLSKHFGGIWEDELLSLAAELKFIKNPYQESVRCSGRCLIWLLYNDYKDVEVHVADNEEARNLTLKYRDKQKISFYILPLSAVEEYHFQFPDNTFEILKYIDNYEK